MGRSNRFGSSGVIEDFVWIRSYLSGKPIQKPGAVESAIDAASGKVSEVFSGKETAGFLNQKCIFPNSLNDLILLHKQKKQTEKARKKEQTNKKEKVFVITAKTFFGFLSEEVKF
ncbi:hypothetical protein [Ileibacterium valens]|uniref:hypothetical protein n=1 Tax=Ileibacterium valens TaxID=1862668 RepID=UPI0024B9C090|nr:hypothetical protein [Ileibacterium valens]